MKLYPYCILENETISNFVNFSNKNDLNEKERFEMNLLIDLVMTRLDHANDTVKKLMGFSLDQTKICHFDYKPCELDWFFSYKHGNCFQFNIDKNQYMSEIILSGQSSSFLNVLHLVVGPLINRNTFSTFYTV